LAWEWLLGLLLLLPVVQLTLLTPLAAEPYKVLKKQGKEPYSWALAISTVVFVVADIGFLSWFFGDVGADAAVWAGDPSYLDLHQLIYGTQLLGDIYHRIALGAVVFLFALTVFLMFYLATDDPVPPPEGRPPAGLNAVGTGPTFVRDEAASAPSMRLAVRANAVRTMGFLAIILFLFVLL
ncbi:MAG TPA: hypothetical protein VGR56_08335, partial [Nitrososphaerales archaeon]|nr:hypothetical protein [Nitrososphaerales archaeon]